MYKFMICTTHIT